MDVDSLNICTKLECGSTALTGSGFDKIVYIQKRMQGGRCAGRFYMEEGLNGNNNNNIITFSHNQQGPLRSILSVLIS